MKKICSLAILAVAILLLYHFQSTYNIKVDWMWIIVCVFVGIGAGRLPDIIEGFFF